MERVIALLSALNMSESDLINMLEKMLQSRAKTFAICDNCQRAYTPKRQPREGEKHYCLECGRRAAKKNYQRVYRQKQRGDT